MDPSDAPQPPKKAAYTTEGNPTTHNPSEQAATHHHPQGQPREERLPSTQSSQQDAVPSSLGWGVHGAPPAKDWEGKVPSELEGDQMRAPGEGDVADAVRQKPGASGSQPDLASDLDRKKAEQAEKREAIKDARSHGELGDEADPRGFVKT